MRDSRWLEWRRGFQAQHDFTLGSPDPWGSAKDAWLDGRIFARSPPDSAALTSYALTASPSTVTEGNQVTFTIRRSGDKPAETVYFSTLSDGTATYGEGDYRTTSGGQPANIAVTFSSGTTSKTIMLDIIDDGVSDSGEQFRAIVQRNASDPVSTYLDRSSYVTINDAAASTDYSLTASPTTVTEGNQVTFTISRSGDKPAETIYFSTLSDGTATYGEGDYTTTSGGQPSNIAVSFSSGTTSRTVTLNIISDGVSDSGEQFSAIVQRSSSDPVSTYLDRSSYVTINDAAASTSYSLSPSVTSVVEGNQIIFTITRSGDKPAETVYFSTLSDGTATYAEGDYTTTSGGQPANVAVNFSSGETSETVTLNIVNDGVSDSGEQFRAIVQRSSSDPVSTYLDRSAFVTINDAAASTTYSLTPSVATVTEGNQVTFTITRSGDKPAETVYFSTLSDGTATYAEGDYTTTSGGQPANIAVNFASGAATQTVTLNIVNDGVSDSGEQFRAIVQRNTSDPVSTYLDLSGFVTINDAASSGTTYSLTPATTLVMEGGQLVFTITRTGDKPAETIYFSTLADGTATYAEGDYTTTAGGQPANIAVTFASGATSQTVTLNIVNDAVSDSGEQFRAIVQRNSSDPVTTYLSRSDFVTINDAGAQNTAYSLTPSSASIIEGDQVTFTISRTGDRPDETIYFSTLADGSATYGEGDYDFSGAEPENIAVHFTNGQQTRTITLDVANDGVNDTGERFRAIVQRDDQDPASLYLARSDYVTISDPAPPPEQTQYFPSFVNVAQAEDNVIRLAGFRYPVSTSGVVTDRQGDPDGWQTSQDLGSGTISSLAGHVGHQHYHLGEDWNEPTDADAGQHVYAIFHGRVARVVSNHPGFGNVAIIEHPLPDGTVVYSLYAHLASFASGMAEDAPFTAGQDVGRIGHTGADNNHLHFEIFKLDSHTSLDDYLSGSVTGLYGYTEDPSNTFTYTGDAITSYISYMEGGVTWFNPSNFIDNHKDFVIVSNEDNSTTANIFSRGADAVINFVESAKEVVLSWFEEIKVVGGDAIDKLNIGSLFGTTIEQNTIYFDGGAGDDEVNGVGADRRIVAEGGDDHDQMTGGYANDRLDGGGGDDTLNGGAGADTMIGGGADDWFYVDNVGDQVSENPGEGADRLFASLSYVLTAGAEIEVTSTTNHAGTAAINLTGNELANTIYGNDGTNILDGKAGADTLVGRLGDDWFYVDDVGDRLIETAGQGNDRVFASVSYILAAGVSVEKLTTTNNTGTAAVNLTGNELANVIYGNDGSNILDGKAGADSLTGLGGNDFYYIDNAADRISELAGQGSDRVLAGVSYALAAGQSVESLTTLATGGTAVINLTGNAFAQAIVGNAGANQLDGGGGGDTMAGLGGDDFYIVRAAGDRAIEVAGGGNDRVFAAISYTLETGSAIETLTTSNNAGTGAINLTGNELANTIYGNAGVNVLDGRAGSDVLVGLAGADSFAFTTTLGAGNVDRIVDFSSVADTIRLDDAVFAGIGTLGTLGANAFVTGATAADASDRIVYNQATGQLFFDRDGNGAGAAVLFATLQGAPVVNAADFVVI